MIFHHYIMIKLLISLILIIIGIGIILVTRIQSNINTLDSELTACELADIMQDDSEEDEDVKFSINSLINQTLKERT